MNKIEEQIKKFLSIKQKIPNSDLVTLTKAQPLSSCSILSYLIKKKNKSSNKNTTNNTHIPNRDLTEKSGEEKPKEKNKFITQKQEEKNKTKTQQGRNHGNNSEQGHNNKEKSPKNSDSPGKSINLLEIVYDNMDKQKIQEILSKKHEEEKNNTMEEKNNHKEEAGDEEMKEEKEEKEEKDKINNNELSFDEEEKDKNDEQKNNEIHGDNMNINSSILNLQPFESGLNVVQDAKFNLFDRGKIEEENYHEGLCDYNIDDCFDDKNKETHNKYEDMILEKENNNKIETENENKNTNKICIELEEEEKEKNENKKKIKKSNQTPRVISKINTNQKNTNTNNEELLKKKKNRISQSEARINSHNSKTENITNFQKNIMSSKNKSKVIKDEDEDDEEYFNKENNKPKKTILEKKEFEPVIKNEGNKIQIFFEDDEDKNDEENKVINKKNIAQKEKDIKIEIEKEKKINKNKNESHNNNNPPKNNNNIYNNNYDISCLENIRGILIKIKEKLNKDSKANNANKKCLEFIDNIKNNNENYQNDLIKRKKDTYICVYKILRILFNSLSEQKISNNFVNEILAIFCRVEMYYKSIKENDNSINKSDYYYKRKTVFKYAYSKMKLKSYELQDIKELYTNNTSFNNNKNDKMVKYIKTNKRYMKTSWIIYKELKDFREKLINGPKTALVDEFLKKYDRTSLGDIQMSPHFMGINRLFAHLGLIFSFHMDSNNKKLINEIEEQKKNDERKKGKSVQINRNGINGKRDSSINSVKMKNNK